MVKIEEILGKKSEEIPFYEDTQKMIDYLHSLTEVIHPLQSGTLYRRMEEHYRELAQLDGLKDFLKVADYLAERAGACESLAEPSKKVRL